MHGRSDVICPLQSAWELHRAWSQAAFQVIGEAGHAAFEPGIAKALVAVTDRFAGQLAEAG